jgi:glutamate/tyrosine decarboxylase-like PLP-dependent enzyme
VSGDDIREKTKQLAAWFLGPKAENAELEEKMVTHILRDYFHWRRNYFPSDEIVIPQSLRREAEAWNDRLEQQVAEMLAGLRRHFPFYNPRYIAHMMCDQTMPSVLGYFAGMLYNPNNVTPEAAPVTEKWELEVGADILRMLGYTPPPQAGAESKGEFGWAHVTGGGTVANLEALWVARNVRYFPLAVRDACIRHRIPLAVRLNAHSDPIPLDMISPDDALGMRPNQGIYLFSRFADAVRRHYDLARHEAIRVACQLTSESEFSIPHHGAHTAFGLRPPVIFAAGTRHYSLTKAVNLLGLGKENLILVETDSLFRMETRDFQAKLERVLADGRLPLAVIAVAGTTEEGAMDPIHEIAQIRGDLERTRQESFWLHVDAAWGGYLRTVLTPGEDLSALSNYVSRPLTIRRANYEKRLDLRWGHREVWEAIEAFPRAESITVDPHKMGYVPYPCGVVAFQNDLVRQFLTEEIPYISATHAEDLDARHHRAPATVGPFILEGSKPGAAVAACWLSHRMIPPDRSGYGEIVRASLLAARELYERLVHWDLAARAEGETLPYHFVPIAARPPDTNIVCFLVQERPARSLLRTNAVNECIYKKSTIVPEHAAEYSYAQPFFLSRTIFSQENYPIRSVRELLERAEIDPFEYREHGLFVLRATVMSPYHLLAAETGHRQSLLADLLEHLAARAGEALSALS